MAGTVYAVAGNKGGVGKTTTAANLAATVRATGQEVVLVDADLAMADLQAVLGIDHEPTVHDVLAGECSLAAARLEESEDALETPGRLDVLPGATDLDSFAAADPAALPGVFERLASEYDTVVVDTASGITRGAATAVGAADETIVVTTPDEAAVRDTHKTVEFVDSQGGAVAGLVISRHCSGLDDEQISQRVGTELLATVPALDRAGVDPLGPYRTLASNLLGGPDTTLDIGEPPRITSMLRETPERATVSTTPATDPATATDGGTTPETEQRSGRFGRFVNAINSQGD